MIDAAHDWAPRTLENACRTLRRIVKKFTSHILPLLHVQLGLTTISHPPLDTSIPLVWSMYHYVSCPSTHSHGAAPS